MTSLELVNATEVGSDSFLAAGPFSPSSLRYWESFKSKSCTLCFFRSAIAILFVSLSIARAQGSLNFLPFLSDAKLKEEVYLCGLTLTFHGLQGSG